MPYSLERQLVTVMGTSGDRPASDGSDPAEYFAKQRRFRDDELNMDAIRKWCKRRTRRLESLEEQFPHHRH